MILSKVIATDFLYKKLGKPSVSLFLHIETIFPLAFGSFKLAFVQLYYVKVTKESALIFPKSAVIFLLKAKRPKIRK